jgi:hypothetical protein
VKRSAMGHTKLKKLQRRTGESLRACVGLMELLWHLTAREAPRGDIGRLSDEDIAIALEWEKDPEDLVEILVDCGWVDRSEKYRLLIHDWHEHADDATKVALKRKSVGFVTTEGDDVPECRDMSRHVPDSRAGAKPEPKPEPKREPKPEPEIPPTPLTGEGAPAETPSKKQAPPDWEAWWDRFLAFYPERDGDRRAAKGREAFKAALARGENPERILAGVQRYREWADTGNRTGTPYVQQITTWLSNRCWNEPWDLPRGGNGPPGRATPGSMTGGRQRHSGI